MRDHRGGSSGRAEFAKREADVSREIRSRSRFPGTPALVQRSGVYDFHCACIGYCHRDAPIMALLPAASSEGVEIPPDCCRRLDSDKDRRLDFPDEISSNEGVVEIGPVSPVIGQVTRSSVLELAHFGTAVKPWNTPVADDCGYTIRCFNSATAVKPWNTTKMRNRDAKIAKRASIRPRR